MIAEYLRELKLPCFREFLDLKEQQGNDEHWTYRHFLYELMKEEYERRVENRKGQRIKRAGFPEMKYLQELERGKRTRPSVLESRPAWRASAYTMPLSLTCLRKSVKRKANDCLSVFRNASCVMIWSFATSLDTSPWTRKAGSNSLTICHLEPERSPQSQRPICPLSDGMK